MPMNNEAAKVHLVTCLADALEKSISVKRPGKWTSASRQRQQVTLWSWLRTPDHL